MEVPVSGSYHLLDKNINDCNIVPATLYRDLLDKTCQIILDACRDHCGPRATFAILEELAGTNRMSFSKDGMDIINSISFVNSTQDTIRRLLAYCASNSDRTVGDGTTSAMIITISALRSINAFLRRQEKLIPFYKLRKDYEDFTQKYLASNAGVMTLEQVITNVREHLTIAENDSISDEDLHKIVVYHVAYYQAYISSHGDKDLSRAVAIMFSNTPQDCWDHIFFKKSIFEKEERFITEFTSDQFVTNAKIMHKSMLSTALGGRIKYTNATLIPLPHPILASHLKYFKVLKEIIEDHVINKKELLIIHAKSLDDATTMAINTIFEDLKDRNFYNTTVAILRHEPLMEEINDISVLNLICKKMPTHVDEMFNVFYGVQVDFDQFNVRLNNLYENPTKSVIHPLYDDPSFPLFKDCAEHIKDQMDQYKKGGITYTRKDDIMNFHEMYNKMKYTSRVVITVGGQTHDSTSAIPVIKDAIYATRSTLQKGFELGAASGLLLKCLDLCPSSVDAPDFIRSSFISAVHDLHAIISGDGDDLYSLNLGDYHDFQLFDLYTEKKVSLRNIASNIATCISESMVDGGDKDLCVNMEQALQVPDDNIVVIQPREINNVIIKRFGDLFLRMLSSSKIISVGGVIVNDKK